MTVRRSALVVGAADDPAERDADRVADEVIRALDAEPGGVILNGTSRANESARVRRSSALTGGTTSPPTAGETRVRRSAAVGLDGGQLDAATSDAIDRRRGQGAPLDGRVRRRMESGFGADLGNIRVHTGGEASALNESMQAQAFTVGSDIFMHGSAPSASTSSGERLLAHEIAHTFQQQGGASRQVRRKLMSVKAFNASTDEGTFTQSSKAQKSIRVLLKAYHEAYPWESQMGMSATETTAAVEKLEEIRQVAKLWIADHEVDVNGTTKADPKRVKRRAGMDQLVIACEAEMLVMRDLAKFKQSGDVVGADHDLSAITVSQESEAFTKVKQKYDGDATSAFRKLGFLIDGAVPVKGDKSSVSMEVTIPIPPGFISLNFETEASRGDDDRVEAGITVGVSGGASVGSVAKLSAGIGCFLTAKAKTGADVTELMSYALFRRCRQSPVVPREITNMMFGGGRSGDYGWVKAEEWSLGVERRILGADAEAEVSSGVYGKLAAEVEVSKDLASLGFEVKGTSGDTINQESLTREKGGAGARNKTSGGGLVSTGGGMRGTTQKSLATQNLGLETSASFSAGILSGGISAAFGWSKTKMVAGKPTYEFDKFEISANLAGEMPMNKMAGDKIAALIPNLVGTINKIIRGSTQAAQAETAARAGGAITEDVGSYAAQIAELTSVSPETWQPFAADPATAGGSIGSTASVELSGTFDFKADAGAESLVVELRLGKSSAIADAVRAGGDVVQVFKLDISKSSRLLKL
ncbi:MAG: DUF4157 domain-containing protein, partial [Ilumatobacteraceae bacterium]